MIQSENSARGNIFFGGEKDMPLVIPYYKKPAKLRERYKTVETYQAFDLQVLKRGKPSISRPLCRILVRAFDRTSLFQQSYSLPITYSKRTAPTTGCFVVALGSPEVNLAAYAALVRKYNSRPPYDTQTDFEPRNGTTAQRNFQRWSPEM